MKELKNLYETIRLIQHFGGIPLILHVGRVGIGKTAGAFTISQLFYPRKFSFIDHPDDAEKAKRFGTIVLDGQPDYDDLRSQSGVPFSKTHDFITKCGKFGVLPQIVEQEISNMRVRKEAPCFIFHYVDKGEARILYPAFDSVFDFEYKFIWVFDEPRDAGWEEHKRLEQEKLRRHALK